MTPALLIAAAMLAAVILYFLLGGADFGGGVWDLLASGPRKQAQRAAIEAAVAPVWEVNHVWLILVVVLLFGAFPQAFALITTALHVPLTLFLFGIVCRGSAFAFRSQLTSPAARSRFGLVFSIASILGPLMLGACVGAIVSGDIQRHDGAVTSGFWMTWLRPFPLAAGLFAVVLTAYIAATYLAYETNEPDLRDDFRHRALASGAATGALALVCAALSREGAPAVYLGLTERAWTWPFHGVTGACAVLAFWALSQRRYGLARVAVSAQTSFILIGWALSQYPYLVVDELTVTSAAAPARTLNVLLVALGAGIPVLAPSLFILMRIFKGARHG